jgi:HD-GYP domain-containing protein (c-di-GMP phosphodiesterase class II)
MWSNAAHDQDQAGASDTKGGRGKMAGVKVSSIMVGKALFAKSAQLYQHALVTGEVARRIVAASGCNFGLRPAEAYCAGLVHDVGKLFIPDAILGKFDRLESVEWEMMQRHPLWGVQFVRGTPLERFQEAVAYHHERVDGSGYPYGRKGAGFPLVARLVQVADRVAAQLDDRSYLRRIEHAGFILREIRPTVEELFPRHFEPICTVLRDFLAGHGEPMAPLPRVHLIQETVL